MDSHTLIQALIYLGSAALIVPIAVRLESGIGTWLPDRRLHYWPVGAATGDRCRIYSALCRDWRGADAVYYRPRTLIHKGCKAACGSVRRWRIADGDLRRPAGAVLHVTWAALAGRGIDRHDAGAPSTAIAMQAMNEPAI